MIIWNSRSPVISSRWNVTTIVAAPSATRKRLHNDIRLALPAWALPTNVITPIRITERAAAILRKYHHAAVWLLAERERLIASISTARRELIRARKIEIVFIT